MSDFGFAEMQQIQKELQDKYKDKWMTIEPATAKSKLLWLVAELGEVIDIVKKDGDKVKPKEKIATWDAYQMPIIAEEDMQQKV